MATFDITITYPDEAQARILAALKTHFDVESNGDAVEAFRDACRSGLKQIVLSVERESAIATAKEGVSEVAVT